MKNAAIIVCFLILGFWSDGMSAQTRLVKNFWQKGNSVKTAVPFPILTVNQKSKWTFSVRSKEEKNIVVYYDSVLVTGQNGLPVWQKRANKYDANAATLPLRSILLDMGLARLPAVDEGLVSIQSALDSNGAVTHWLLIDNAKALLWIGPIQRKGKYIRVELVLRFLPEPLKLDEAMVQNLEGSVMFKKGQELKILSGSGEESALKTDGMVTIMNRQMIPMVSGDTSWMVWTDDGPKRFGYHMSDLLVRDSLAGKVYWDGRDVRVLWPNGDFATRDLGVGKHQLDFQDKNIGKASVREILDFGVVNSVIWYDSNNRIITPVADSIYGFKLTNSWLYSAKNQKVLGLVDTAGKFHDLPIASYGRLTDARMTDLSSVAEEENDSLIETDIEESEDLSIVQYQRVDGRLDSAYVWPKHNKLTPYWGKPLYARDSLYLFRSITGRVEILLPDNDFSGLSKRYHIIKGAVADSNIHDFRPVKIGKSDVVKLGFRRDQPAMMDPVGFDWLWTESGRITVDLGTFLGYAEMKGYKDSSIYIFMSSGRITLLSTEDWWTKSFQLSDLPEYIPKSEFTVTVWNKFVNDKGESVEIDTVGVKEFVYARIVVDKKKADGTNLYDQLNVLTLGSH